MNLGEYFGLDNPAFQIKTDENGNTVAGVRSLQRRRFSNWRSSVLWTF